MKDNRCISLSLQAVYLNHLCSNFPNHLLEKENNLHLLPFGGKTERNEAQVKALKV